MGGCPQFACIVSFPPGNLPWFLNALTSSCLCFFDWYSTIAFAWESFVLYSSKKTTASSCWEFSRHKYIILSQIIVLLVQRTQFHYSGSKEKQRKFTAPSLVAPVIAS